VVLCVHYVLPTVLRGYRYTGWLVELSIAATKRAPLAGELTGEHRCATGTKILHAVVLCVHHVLTSILRGYRDAGRLIELSIAAAKGAPLAPELTGKHCLAAGTKVLHAVVLCVHHVLTSVVGRYRDAGRLIELSIAIAKGAPLAGELPVPREVLHAVVLCIHYVHPSILGRYRYAGRLIELSIATAKGAPFAGELAVPREVLHAVVLCIRHVHSPILGGYRYAGRLIELSIADVQGIRHIQKRVRCSGFKMGRCGSWHAGIAACLEQDEK